MKIFQSILSFVLIFLFTSNLSAQDVGTSWGVQMFPNFSYRKLIPVNTAITQEDVFAIGEMEQGKFSYSAGIVTEFHWGPKVGFQTGLNYHQTGYETKRRTLILDDGTQIDQEETYEYLGLDVPFILNFYQEFTPKTRIYFMMGGTALANLRNQLKTTTYNSEDAIGQTNTNKIEAKTNSIVFSIYTGMGVEQFVSDRVSVFLQPSFQFFLKPVIDDSQLARIPFGLGVSFGVKLRPFVN